MSDHLKTRRNNASAPDFAAQMARAEFGRHYVDADRTCQTLHKGEIVFRDKAPPRRATPRREGG